jgi:hypothetical protein
MEVFFSSFLVGNMLVYYTLHPHDNTTASNEPEGEDIAGGF